MTTHFLSKSRYVDGCLCPRRLWLATHRPELAEKTGSPIAIAHGSAIGEVAQRLYPHGRLVGDHNDKPGSIQRTREALASDEDCVLFEAAFRHDGVFVMADILEKTNGQLTLVEVKASSEAKPYHRHDLALQTWVLTGSGYPPAHTLLRHTNDTFIYRGDGDYRGLLVDEDLSSETLIAQPQVAAQLSALRTMLDGAEPDTPMGKQCKDPWTCAFAGYCEKLANPAEYPLTDLPSSGKLKLVKELRAEGIQDIRDIPPARLTDARHRRIQQACLTGQAQLDPTVREVMRQFGYPRYFLDFETIALAVPRWAGMRSKESHVACQWAMHVIPSPGAKPVPLEYLHPDDSFPVRATMEHLIEAIGREGPVFVYSSYEQTVLKKSEQWLPDLAGPLQAIRERLVDLCKIAGDYYYHPDMHGSWSIKKVLPTVAPDLSYKGFKLVKDGDSAQAAYMQMIDSETPPETRAALRQELLDYCRLDSLAMVRVAEYLECGSTLSK